MAHTGHLDRFPYYADDFSCLAAHCPSNTLTPSRGVCARGPAWLSVHMVLRMYIKSVTINCFNVSYFAMKD